MNIEGNKPVALVVIAVGVALSLVGKPLLIALGLQPPVLVAGVAFSIAVGIIFVLVGIVSLFRKPPAPPQS